MADYRSGDILDFPYLWAWQARRGETEGRKDRPCCLALISPMADGRHRIFLLPITTTPPGADDDSMPVPPIEARRAGLDAQLRQWVILSEWNVDLLETSYYLDHHEPRGRFSRAFLHKVLTHLRLLLQAGELRSVRRDE